MSVERVKPMDMTVKLTKLQAPCFQHVEFSEFTPLSQIDGLKLNNTLTLEQTQYFNTVFNGFFPSFRRSKSLVQLAASKKAYITEDSTVLGMLTNPYLTITDSKWSDGLIVVDMDEPNSEMLLLTAINSRRIPAPCAYTLNDENGHVQVFWLYDQYPLKASEAAKNKGFVSLTVSEKRRFSRVFYQKTLPQRQYLLSTVTESLRAQLKGDVNFVHSRMRNPFYTSKTIHACFNNSLERYSLADLRDYLILYKAYNSGETALRSENLVKSVIFYHKNGILTRKARDVYKRYLKTSQNDAKNQAKTVKNTSKTNQNQAKNSASTPASTINTTDNISKTTTVVKTVQNAANNTVKAVSNIAKTTTTATNMATTTASTATTAKTGKKTAQSLLSSSVLRQNILDNIAKNEAIEALNDPTTSMSDILSMATTIGKTIKIGERNSTIFRCGLKAAKNGLDYVSLANGINAKSTVTPLPQKEVDSICNSIETIVSKENAEKTGKTSSFSIKKQGKTGKNVGNKTAVANTTTNKTATTTAITATATATTIVSEPQVKSCRKTPVYKTEGKLHNMLVKCGKKGGLNAKTGSEGYKIKIANLEAARNKAVIMSIISRDNTANKLMTLYGDLLEKFDATYELPAGFVPTMANRLKISRATLYRQLAVLAEELEYALLEGHKNATLIGEKSTLVYVMGVIKHFKARKETTKLVLFLLKTVRGLKHCYQILVDKHMSFGLLEWQDKRVCGKFAPAPSVYNRLIHNIRAKMGVLQAFLNHKVKVYSKQAIHEMRLILAKQADNIIRNLSEMERFVLDIA